MKTDFSLLAFLLVSACGKSSDSTFDSYIQQFQDSAVKHGHSEFAHSTVSIVFGDAKGNNAVCNHGLPNQIVVDADKWNIMPDDESKYVIFHELGHCILGRAHDNELVNAIPKSIMNGQPMGQTIDFIRLDLEKFENELFNP